MRLLSLDQSGELSLIACFVFLSLYLQDNGVGLAERMEKAVQTLKQVYSECPSYDEVGAKSVKSSGPR